MRKRSIIQMTLVGVAVGAALAAVALLFLALAAAVLDERIGPPQILGGILILAGVLALRSERPLPPSERLTPLDSP